MSVKFIPEPTAGSKGPIVISGPESMSFGRRAFILYDNNEPATVYEIKYEYNSSPFKQVEMLGNLLLAGYEERFYIFDTTSETSLLSLPLKWYFGSFYVEDGYIYVANANGIYCVETNGKVCWSNDALGIDGVVMEQFTPTQIRGKGEWDPPNGWRDFVVDKQTGRRL
jgi:hypothetical protein